jgi:hypothetical protein
VTRKIEDAMIQAIKAHRNWTSGNTQVQAMCDGTVMVFLHSHQIAQIGNDTAHWTLAGWNTATTRSRINAMARAFGWRSARCIKGEPHVSESTGNPEELSVWRPIGAKDWINALA